MTNPASGFRIEPLSRDHDRLSFACGEETLDRYLREQALQDARKRVAAPFALFRPVDGRIAGYYTLSSASLRADDLSPKLIKELRLPRYPYLPATLIGRLAVDLSFRGKGIGELLLLDALRRAWRATAQVASLGVIVDAKNEQVVRFYSKYNFIVFPNSPERLFLPMKTIEKLFAGTP